jgi:uncharacterized protein (TIGR03083 family)
MATEDIQELIAAQRGDLATMLEKLPDSGWDEPTLCDGWRVRETVAHITMPFRYSGGKFLRELAKSRGNFTAMADRLARADARALSPAELTEAVRANARFNWKPPGGGYTGALSHDVIHSLDITVPLGLGFTVPEERLRHVLPESVTQKSVKYFGVDLDGVQFRATDLDWTLGSGGPVTGTAQDLLLAICGRKLPAGHLEGEQSARFTAA